MIKKFSNKIFISKNIYSFLYFLVYAVYDYDRFSKHDAIGEVRLPVCQMDLAQTKEIWKELQSIVGDGKVSDLL